MKSIQVLIVDDQLLAQDILEAHLNKLPAFEVVGKCKNALDAFGILSKQHVDIMLLDINMPEISGIEFIKTIKNPPLIIFTTAYPEFAVESYEYNVVDYLVKPISFERFLKAINKAVDSLEVMLESNTAASFNPISTDHLIFVKSEGKLIKVDVTKVFIIEGLRDYIRIWTDSEKIIMHSTMKNIEDQLSKYPMFIRVHKSFIVNINYITEIDGNSIRIKDQLIAIGTTYKEGVAQLFNNRKIR